MSDERIRGLVAALNTIADMLEGHCAEPWARAAWIEATAAVRQHGGPLDAQRGLFSGD